MVTITRLTEVAGGKGFQVAAKAAGDSHQHDQSPAVAELNERYYALPLEIGATRGTSEVLVNCFLRPSCFDTKVSQPVPLLHAGAATARGAGHGSSL